MKLLYGEIVVNIETHIICRQTRIDDEIES